jgi:hypothetical protein
MTAGPIIQNSEPEGSAAAKRGRFRSCPAVRSSIPATVRQAIPEFLIFLPYFVFTHLKQRGADFCSPDLNIRQESRYPAARG